MKLKQKFQEGGQMPAEQAQPQGQPQGGESQDPMMQIVQAAMQAVQNNDPQMAMQVCQALVQLAQQAQGGGEAQAQPTYQKKGGKLVRIK